MKKVFNLLSLLCTAAAISAQAGNVGINTAAPTQKLHIKGSFRFETSDTANPAAAGTTLVSDASGNAAWKNITATAKNYHPAYSTSPYMLDNYYDTSLSNEFLKRLSPTKYTGTSITLPAGSWIVYIALIGRIQYTTNRNASTPVWGDLPADRSVWIRSTLSENTNGANKNTPISDSGISGDIVGPNLVSNVVAGPSSSTIVAGELFIRNSSGAAKTYYLKVSDQVDGFVNNSEGARLVDFGIQPSVTNNTNLSNKIIAYPAQF